jgi:pyruvate,water dikinase
MQPYNSATGEWNDSHRGEYLWSNANFGEAIPGIMTPLTWSLVKIFGEETFGNPLPGNNPLMGNIAGRFYVNLSLIASAMGAVGMSRERINRESEEFFGNLPEDIEVPIIPFSRPAVLRRFLPFAVRTMRRRLRNLKELTTFTAGMPEQVEWLYEKIQGAESPADLAQLWRARFEPLLRRAYQMMQAGTSQYENAYRPLHHKLVAQVGEENANLLLSGVSLEGERLASLGPLFGLWQVAEGELSREAYLRQYGHRGEHEFEVSWPRPAEDPAWLDQQLATLAGMDVPALLSRREAAKRAAWEQYRQQFPKEAARREQQIQKTAACARKREAIRSEVTRLLGAARHFAIQAGRLSGLGEDSFFLSLEELLAVLEGQELIGAEFQAEIAARRRANQDFSALPPYPALIKGRFDPAAWAAAPDRRTDLYDALAQTSRPKEAYPNGLIQGLPGSAGIVEGFVRRLESMDEGPHLQPGEILVAVTTNVGWTPLFPRAAAVVTDVGAPLSHAAIVARELGIPAVVGTGQATMRLKTGDRVRVNGTAGTVELL